MPVNIKIPQLAIIWVLGISPLFAQQYFLQSGLNNNVSETSGLIYLNNTLITHNDSGNTNQLYDIDLSTGAILRTVTITNASNVDWEDITHDDNYIYVGDFGNFDASRNDLKVFRIGITDYFNSTTVSADLINFSYNDQSDFSPQPFATNFDAEALLHFNDKLYIFTKNWADGKCTIYELPKVPGSYSISPLDEIDSQGLVTGATLNESGTSVLLCGYDVNGPFLIELKSFSTGLFSNGSLIKTPMTAPPGFSPQTEGITALNSDEFLVSSEATTDPQGLFRFNLSTLSTLITDTVQTRVFPNPARQRIFVSGDRVKVDIYAIQGQHIGSYLSNTIDVSKLTRGIYLLHIKDLSTNQVQIQQLIIR